jgi:hypothetical protein
MTKKLNKKIYFFTLNVIYSERIKFPDTIIMT